MIGAVEKDIEEGDRAVSGPHLTSISLPEGLVASQIAGPNSQSSWCSRSEVGSAFPTSPQVRLILLVWACIWRIAEIRSWSGAWGSLSKEVYT